MKIKSTVNHAHIELLHALITLFMHAKLCRDTVFPILNQVYMLQSLGWCMLACGFLWPCDQS